MNNKMTAAFINYKAFYDDLLEDLVSVSVIYTILI